jgi:molybdopterin-guanine dinucleotide biosynthesis protein A
MGRDKGTLDYHGRPQAAWAAELLESVGLPTYLSVRADQADEPPYCERRLVLDSGAGRGPAAGLLAAFDLHPEAAWLVLAADMPLVDRVTLAALVDARDPAAVATGFVGLDGIAEPLCAIFEPAARAALMQAPLEARSLRRVLEAGKLLAPPVPERLASVNTPEDDARVRETLARSSQR